TPAECVQCKLCEESCPFDAINPPTPERPPEPRKKGVRRLAVLVALLPILVLAGAGTGMAVHNLLARMHPTVALAERIAAENAGKFTDMTIDSETFRSGDKTTDELYQEAREIRDRFKRGSVWFGAFIGLVIGCKLIGLSVVRNRDGYEPDRVHCYSCGRCFAYCPVKKEK
ncbi:MAG: 4Fe-4S binding protein, partial [Candidatus Hydrogenedentes bacterium]|nr:4Fe-4S binding protein [Candidatus Hydrogenedentota bacterium]